MRSKIKTGKLNDAQAGYLRIVEYNLAQVARDLKPIVKSYGHSLFDFDGFAFRLLKNIGKNVSQIKKKHAEAISEVPEATGGILSTNQLDCMLECESDIGALVIEIDDAIDYAESRYRGFHSRVTSKLRKIRCDIEAMVDACKCIYAEHENTMPDSWKHSRLIGGRIYGAK